VIEIFNQKTKKHSKKTTEKSGRRNNVFFPKNTIKKCLEKAG